MKILRRLAIGIPLAYITLMLIAGLVAKYALSGKLHDSVLAKAQEYLPVEVAIESADFSLKQWMLLQPAVAVQGLTLGNAPNFPSKNVLEAGEVSVQVSLLSLFSDQIDVRYFRLDRPSVFLDNKSSGTNLQAIIEATKRKRAATQPQSAEAAPESSDSPGIAIEGLSITSGAVHYTNSASGGQSKTVTIDDIDLQLTNFSADSSCDINFAARLFSSSDSTVRFNGRAGPFSADSIPASGDLDADLAPNDLPKDMRDKYLGELLREPGSGSGVALATAMEGDLVGIFKGSGTLTVADLEIGGDPDTRLPLNGQVPLKLAVIRLMERPVVDLLISDAGVSMGEGQWKGQAELHYNGNRFWGGSRGAIEGVRINEFVSAFSSARDKVFGNLALERYEMSFSGRNADEMKNSLNGKGQIDIQEGYISLFDLFATIDKYSSKLLGGGDKADGQTQFTTFISPVQIRDRQVYLPDAILKGSSSAIRGQGHITFDKQLHFDLQAGYSGTLATTLGGKPGPDGQPQIVIPVRVRGTVDAPRVTPDFGEVIKRNIPGILESIFGNRKKENSTEDSPQAPTP